MKMTSPVFLVFFFVIASIEGAPNKSKGKYYLVGTAQEIAKSMKHKNDTAQKANKIKEVIDVKDAENNLLGDKVGKKKTEKSEEDRD